MVYEHSEETIAKLRLTRPHVRLDSVVISTVDRLFTRLDFVRQLTHNTNDDIRVKR